LYWEEGCDLAMEEVELRRLDCDSATEVEKDNFLLLEGWLSAVDSRWNS
jgi:hypothetical protein